MRARLPYISSAVARTSEGLLARGYHPIVITSPSVRGQLWQILESRIPGIVVLAYNEIEKGIDVESTGLVRMETAQPSMAGVA